jgi:hypothetical protein
LQLKINDEATKFGFDDAEILDFFEKKENENFKNIQIVGMMGMATFTDDMNQVRNEFKHLKRIFSQIKNTYFADNELFKEISMGMSDDYPIALEEGATMIRIGSLIFGKR